MFSFDGLPSRQGWFSNRLPTPETAISPNALVPAGRTLLARWDGREERAGRANALIVVNRLDNAAVWVDETLSSLSFFEVAQFCGPLWLKATSHRSLGHRPRECEK